MIVHKNHRILWIKNDCGVRFMGSYVKTFVNKVIKLVIETNFLWKLLSWEIRLLDGQGTINSGDKEPLVNKNIVFHLLNINKKASRALH